MTNFEKITQSPETLGAFLASLPIPDAPWDAEFQRKYCGKCKRPNCDGGSGCRHEGRRNNPAWWLRLEARKDANR